MHNGKPSDLPGLKLPPVVLGTMARHQQSDRERIVLLREAVELGFTALDTAPLYGFGAAESQICAALQGVSRDSVQILTKVGLRWDGAEHGAEHFSWIDAQGVRQTVRRNSRPESLRYEVEQSLRRLGADRLDLVQLHFRDPSTPLADSIGALLDLRREGKLAHIGVCNLNTSELDEVVAALGPCPLTAVQSKYNLLQRRAEEDLLPWCRRADVAFLAYSPLAEGLLALKNPTASAGRSRRVRRFLGHTWAALAEDFGRPPVTLALQWLISQPGVTAAIVGASSIEQLRLLASVPTANCAPAEMHEITRAVRNIHLAEAWEGNPLRRAIRMLKRKVSAR